MTASHPRSRSLQERSRETRRRLIACAFELFTTAGFDAVTVDEICASAGVAKGTFYFHFSTKQALLAAAFSDSGADLVGHAERLVAAGEKFTEAVVALGDRVAGGAGTLPKRLVFESTVNALAAIDPEAAGSDAHHDGHNARRAFLVLVNAARERGEVTTRYEPSELAMTLNWAIVQGLLTWSAQPRSRPVLARVVRRRLGLALEGMGP